MLLLIVQTLYTDHVRRDPEFQYLGVVGFRGMGLQGNYYVRVWASRTSGRKRLVMAAFAPQAGLHPGPSLRRA